MKKITTKIIRILLGMALLIFGLDKFFEFVPHNHVMTDQLIAAYEGLLANKFIMPTVGVVEAVSGILLISGRYVIVALLAMIPIAFGILGFHLAVDIEGIGPGLILSIMLTYLILTKSKIIGAFIKKGDAV